MSRINEHGLTPQQEAFAVAVAAGSNHGTVLGLRRRAGDIPLFAYLANLAKPVCPKCGTSINMVLHGDEWVCHSTHRSPATITRL